MQTQLVVNNNRDNNKCLQNLDKLLLGIFFRRFPAPAGKHLVRVMMPVLVSVVMAVTVRVVTFVVVVVMLVRLVVVVMVMAIAVGIVTFVMVMLVFYLLGKARKLFF